VSPVAIEPSVLEWNRSSNLRGEEEANILSYALVTPARNEAEFIERTIESVICQSVLPLEWVIVSDGSTDRTDEIVTGYAHHYDWLKLIRMPERRERHFAGKVYAFKAGLERARRVSYDIIGNLDADISFDSEYFGFLLDKFERDPRLGVAGTPYREGTVQYDYRFSRKEHVSGACQLFRRACYESIGGYIPLKDGAVDLAAVVTARMHGWKTETFTDKFCIHHRPMGSAKNGVVVAYFKSGYGDYRMGVHPLWQVLRSFYQMTRKPFVVAGSCVLAGFLWAAVRRAPKPISEALVAFRRAEQMSWLREYGRRFFAALHLASAAKHQSRGTSEAGEGPALAK
jgi:poly-beta-1,6-N-acetyl-D-glucosamine synthase